MTYSNSTQAMLSVVDYTDSEKPDPTSRLAIVATRWSGFFLEKVSGLDEVKVGAQWNTARNNSINFSGDFIVTFIVIFEDFNLENKISHRC